MRISSELRTHSGSLRSTQALVHLKPYVISGFHVVIPSGFKVWGF